MGRSTAGPPRWMLANRRMRVTEGLDTASKSSWAVLTSAVLAETAGTVAAELTKANTAQYCSSFRGSQLPLIPDLAWGATGSRGWQGHCGAGGGGRRAADPTATPPAPAAPAAPCSSAAPAAAPVGSRHGLPGRVLLALSSFARNHPWMRGAPRGRRERGGGSDSCLLPAREGSQLYRPAVRVPARLSAAQGAGK